jgi:chromosome segregation ATPase
MSVARRPAQAARRSLWRWALACFLATGGCYSQEQYDQVLQRSADLQAQLDQTRASLQTQAEELKAEQSRNADLVAAKEKATRAAQDAAAEARQLRRTLEIARRELDSANESLVRQQAELQKALDSQREARSRMEQELADRQREIDVLNSRVRQLERQLEDLRRSAPHTQPSSASLPS